MSCFGSRRVRLLGGFGLWGWLCVVVCGLLLAAGCGGGGEGVSGGGDGSGVVGEGGVVGGGSVGDGAGEGGGEVVPLLDSSGCSDGSWLEDASAGAVSDCEALVGFRNRLTGGRLVSEVWEGFVAGGGIVERRGVEDRAVWGVGGVGGREGE